METTQQKVKRTLTPEEQIERYYREGKVEILPSQNNPSDGEILYSITDVSNLSLIDIDINLIKEKGYVIRRTSQERAGKNIG